MRRWDFLPWRICIFPQQIPLGYVVGLPDIYRTSTEEDLVVAYRGNRVFSMKILCNLTPAESWGDGSQNRLHDMRVVGHAQLVWNGQQ